MPSRTTPKVLYTDYSRRCQRCGMVVLPQAAYCSTCGEPQSMAYSRWQVFLQLLRLWLMVVVVVCALLTLWRVVIPVTVLISPPCPDATTTMIWLVSRTTEQIPMVVTACAPLSIAPFFTLADPLGPLVAGIAERVLWAMAWLVYGESLVWQWVAGLTQTFSAWWAIIR